MARWREKLAPTPSCGIDHALVGPQVIGAGEGEELQDETPASLRVCGGATQRGGHLQLGGGHRHRHQR